MAHSLLLATVACWWVGKAPFVKNCTAWALTCLKAVQQRPWQKREIETRLPDSRVSYNGVVDHRSWLPVLSPLRSCVDGCHVWPNWAPGGKSKRWMFEHVSINRPVWMGFNDLKHLVACCFAAKWRWSHIRDYQKPWDRSGIQAAWNQVHVTEIEYLWDWCSCILPTMSSIILRLSKKFIFVQWLYLQAIWVKFLYKGHQVKVKVTGAENIQNDYFSKVNFDHP